MFCRLPSASNLGLLNPSDFVSNLALFKRVFCLDLIMMDFLDVFVLVTSKNFLRGAWILIRFTKTL